MRGLLKKANNSREEMSFLEHLEALRWHLVRSVIVVVISAIVFFCYRDFLFDRILFAPKSSDFWTYQIFCKLAYLIGTDALCVKDIPFELINTELSSQFTSHIWVSLVAGLVTAFPYVIWELWRFIKPGLHQKERKYTKGVVFFVSLLFFTGVLFGYFLLAPLSINFLATYQVSAQVKNLIQFSSFISTVTTITLVCGLVFELPIVVYFLTKIGLLTPAFMKTYRKHAIVVILILAAVITPSPDVSSQLLVALPLYLLYELSIIVSKRVIRKEKKALALEQAST